MSINRKLRRFGLATWLLALAAWGLLAALSGPGTEVLAQDQHTLTLDVRQWNGSAWAPFTGSGGQKLPEGNSAASAKLVSVHTHLNPARDKPTAVLLCVKDTGTARLRSSILRDGHATVAKDFDLIALQTAATLDPDDATQLKMDRGNCHDHVVPANAAAAAVNILIFGDTIKEGDETVALELRRSGSTPADVVISATAGTTAFTIEDDDGGGPVPTVYLIGGSAVTEGGKAQFTLWTDRRLERSEGRSVWVRVWEAADSDFVPAASEGMRRVDLGAPGIKREFTVPTTDDGVAEADGEVRAELIAGDGYHVGQFSSAGVDVTDDEADAVILLGEVPGEVMEGETLSVEVLINGPATAQAQGTVTLTDSDGSNASADFFNKSTTFWIYPGRKSITVPFTVLADGVSDHGETFHARLSVASGHVTVGSPSEAVFTVVEPAQYEFSDALFSVPEGGGKNVVIARSKGLSDSEMDDQEVTVRVTSNTDDHAASRGADFLAPSETVTVDGVTGKGYLYVSTYSDLLTEGPETVSLEITDAGDGVIGPNNAAVLQIVDVNLVPPDWALAPSGLSDGDRFRLLFLSSGTTDAAGSGINDYDVWLRNLAASGGHAAIQPYAPGFQALGSTADTHAQARAGASPDLGDGDARPVAATTPIYWLNGEQVASNHADLWDGAWSNVSVSAGDVKDESGAAVAQADRHWTGSGGDGAASDNPLGHTGDEVTYGQWSGNPVSAGLADKTQSYPLLGISQVFEVLDKPIFSIDVASGSVTEGENLQYTVRADPAQETAVPVAIQVETEGGYRSASSLSQEVTMPAAAGSHAFSLATLGDAVDEPDGRITLTLMPTDDYRVIDSLQPSGVKVKDDDYTTVTLTPSRTWLNETGDDNAVDLTIGLSRPVGPGELAVIPIGVSGAVVNADYTMALKPGDDVNRGARLLTSGGTTPTSRFPFSVPYSAQRPGVELSPGAQNAVITYTAVDDSVKKSRSLSFGVGVGSISSELFGLGGGGIYLDVSPTSFIPFIDDENTDPVQVSFRLDNYPIRESNNANGWVNLDGIVTLSRAVARDVAVQVNVSGGTATKGEDFEDKDQVTATIPAGFTAANQSGGYHIRSLDDSARESAETFTLTLVDPDGDQSGFTLGSADTMTVTIRDDETWWFP